MSTQAKEVVGADNAHLALTLVGYDKEVEAVKDSEERVKFPVLTLSLQAMAYVFGRTFVCTSTAAARKVTFNKEIRVCAVVFQGSTGCVCAESSVFGVDPFFQQVPSVTLQGDMFDPSGTLSGGSAPAGT